MTWRNDLSLLGDASTAFISRPRKMLIDGRWVGAASGGTIPVFDPSSGLELTTVPNGGIEEVDAAVDAAKVAFESGSWPALQPADRERLLWRLSDLIEQHAQELAELEALDNGKPVGIALAVDLPLTIRHFRYMAGFATRIHGRTISTSVPYMPRQNFLAYTTREPVGVVGAIIPWNMPLMFCAWKLGAALAAGCTVVLKPASWTPLTALRLGELIVEAGFPPGVVNIVTGAGSVVGEGLARHSNVNKIAFTGSTQVGQHLGRICADRVKPISLELGGKSPSIVLKDADLQATLPGIIQGIFINSGQVCSAGSRLYVQRPLYEPLLEALAGAAKALKVGPGLAADTFMGPLVSKEQKETVSGYINSGINEGAVMLAGGAVEGEGGYYVAPTILAEARHDMRVVREEIFGPVLTVTPFDEIEHVLALANDSEMGLAASIYSQDVRKIQWLAPRIQAGTVWVNCHNVFDAGLPFGGYKQSGIGRERGKYGLEEFVETKAMQR
jgi:phenylacetaldehyde dehydrogenase